MQDDRWVMRRVVDRHTADTPKVPAFVRFGRSARSEGGWTSGQVGGGKSALGAERGGDDRQSIVER